MTNQKTNGGPPPERPAQIARDTLFGIAPPGPCLERVRDLAPLTLSITNLVTINECANALLAIGASPVMSDEAADAGRLASLAAGTVLNIGTINDRQLTVALAAGRGARQAGRPVVLDPVGVGATETRRRAAAKIVEEIRPDVIRGNFSEIKALAGLAGEQKGVDSVEAEATEPAAEVARNLARTLGSLVAVTGVADILTDGRTTLLVAGGSPLLTKVTGTGCLLSAMVGAYLAANPENPLSAVLAALVHLALAGERAAADLPRAGALGSFRVGLFDQLALMTGRDLTLFQGVSRA